MAPSSLSLAQMLLHNRDGHHDEEEDPARHAHSTFERMRNMYIDATVLNDQILSCSGPKKDEDDKNAATKPGLKRTQTLGAVGKSEDGLSDGGSDDDCLAQPQDKAAALEEQLLAVYRPRESDVRLLELLGPAGGRLLLQDYEYVFDYFRHKHMLLDLDSIHHKERARDEEQETAGGGRSDKRQARGKAKGRDHSSKRATMKSDYATGSSKSDEGGDLPHAASLSAERAGAGRMVAAASAVRGLNSLRVRPKFHSSGAVEESPASARRNVHNIRSLRQRSGVPGAAASPACSRPVTPVDDGGRASPAPPPAGGEGGAGAKVRPPPHGANRLKLPSVPGAT